MTSRWTKNRFRLFACIIPAVAAIYLLAGAAQAQSSHDSHSTSGHGDAPKDNQEMSQQFKHDVTEAGVKAEFQIMSLKSMNMTDAGGATHHIMVTFVDAASGEQVKEAVGRIKVISPSGAETVADLKDYSGIYAANVTFDEPGKYGVICLAKVAGQKPLYKFWYPHP
jgi:hypothetical protein